MTPIQAIPAEAYRRGPRRSKVLDVIRKSVAEDHAIIAIKGDDIELEKFYRALTQWKGRHPEQPLNVRKGNYVVYVQAVGPVKNAAPPTETAAPAPVPIVAVPLTCEACGQELPIG